MIKGVLGRLRPVREGVGGGGVSGIFWGVLRVFRAFPPSFPPVPGFREALKLTQVNPRTYRWWEGGGGGECHTPPLRLF